MRGIGAMARVSGLTVSALRFYDAQGILAPSWVDPDSGYRWYDDDQVLSARLIAGLRRVGMPLTEIGRLLEAQRSRPIVAAIIDDHLGRLEAGLAEARHELSRVMPLIDDQENPMSDPSTITTLTLRAENLTAALGAVRYAASSDSSLPNLTGVYLDLAGGAVTAVATDRFRLAIAPVGSAGVTGPALGALLPTVFVDELIDVLPGAGDVTVTITDAAAEFGWSGGSLTAALEQVEFPAYRSVLTRFEPSRSVTIDAAAFRAGLAAAPVGESPQSPLLLSVDVTGAFCFDGSRPDALEIGLNPEFLLEALDGYAADPGTQLVLGLDGPIAPLVMSDPARPGQLHLLMPIKLDATV